MNRMVVVFVATVLVAAVALLTMPRPPGGAPAPEANAPVAPAGVTWFRDDDLRVAFAYHPARWVQENTITKHTRHSVSWRTKSGGLIASCFLQAAQNSKLARLAEDEIHPNVDRFAAKFMEDSRKYDPEATLLAKEAAVSSNYPTVLVEYNLTARGLDRTEPTTALSLVTAWRGHEIGLTCHYDDAAREDEQAHAAVRDEVFKVLRTLIFLR